MSTLGSFNSNQQQNSVLSCLFPVEIDTVLYYLHTVHFKYAYIFHQNQCLISLITCSVKAPHRRRNRIHPSYPCYRGFSRDVTRSRVCLVTLLIRHFGGQAPAVVCAVCAVHCAIDTSYQPACGVVCLWVSRKGMIFQHVYHDISR